MRLRCGGIFDDYFITRLLLSSEGERILKTGQLLAMFWVRVGCPVFFTQRLETDVIERLMLFVAVLMPEMVLTSKYTVL